MNLGITITVTTISSVGILSLLFWIFKKSFAGLIEKEIGRDLEKYKHELEIKSEILKHDLIKEGNKASYQASNIQSVYPELNRLLLTPEGFLGNLIGVRETPDWNQMEPIKIKAYLSDLKINAKDISRILDLFQNNAPERSSETQALVDLNELWTTRSQIREAKNFFLLKKLFISPEIQDCAEKIFTKLWSVWCDLETFLRFGRQNSGINMSDVRKEHQDLVDLLDTLEVLMQKELFPS
jgi:hypothetical protein